MILILSLPCGLGRSDGGFGLAGEVAGISLLDVGLAGEMMAGPGLLVSNGGCSWLVHAHASSLVGKVAVGLVGKVAGCLVGKLAGGGLAVEVAGGGLAGKFGDSSLAGKVGDGLGLAG